ncbi:uncharacterized protein LOC120351455, partial [Nilaparvata lugens]|uniref:uncharacterized protein LOC120351455 n=1 Tax=Nilaparvata lugens TaxID=108931 RepID=UPI00193CF3F0
MAFSLKDNYVNMKNSFVNNLNNEGSSETANDDCSETSASSEHLSSIANKVIELNLLRNELINVEQDIADQDNKNRLKRCRLVIEREANILTSLNEKLVFLLDESQQLILATKSFEDIILNSDGLVPEEAQRD